jgi:hypothetical protein
MRLLILIVSVLGALPMLDAAVTAATSDNSYLFNVGFDASSDLAAFKASADGNATATLDQKSVRIDLDKYTDLVPYRTELVPKPLPYPAFDNPDYAVIGQEYWYGIKLFVPSTWVPDNSFEVVTQWHGATTTGDGPPVALRMDLPGTATVYGKNGRATNWRFELVANTYDLGPIAPDVGKWIDWVYCIRWAPDSTGRLTIWRDKVQVLDIRGQTMYPDSKGPYWKFGIYKVPWKQRPTLIPLQSHRTMYFTGVRIAQQANISSF